MVSAGNGVAPSADRQMRKYKALYLEAVCQREAGNLVAYYRLLERAMRLNPNGAEAMFDMAEFATSHGVDKPVVALYERAHSLYPANTRYTYEYASILLSMLNESGVPLMESLLRNEDIREEAFAQLCAYYEVKGDFAKLCATLDKWRPIRDDDEFLSTQKLRAAIKMKHYSEALLIADTLIEHYPANKSEILVAKGEAYLALNQPDEVMMIYNEIESGNEARGNANILLYKYALSTKDKAVERKALSNILLDPSMPSQTRVASLHNLLDDLAQPERDTLRDSLLAKLLPLQEEETTLYTVIADQMIEEKSPDSLLVPVFNKILNIDPSDEYARINLMQNALTHEDYDDLKRLSTDGLKENARQPLFYYYAGAVMQIQKDEKGALDIYVRGLKYITPDTHTELVSRYYSAYADALHKMGRKDEAYVMYDSALVYNNENIMCLNNYAYFLSLDGKNLDKARQMSAKTLEKEPDEPTFLDTYAWILFLQGDYVEARKYIDKALNNTKNINDPDNVSLVDHAGDIYYHLGFLPEAYKYWKQAAKMDPSSAVIKKKAQYQRYFKQ